MVIGMLTDCSTGVATRKRRPVPRWEPGSNFLSPKFNPFFKED